MLLPALALSLACKLHGFTCSSVKRINQNYAPDPTKSAYLWANAITPSLAVSQTPITSVTHLWIFPQSPPHSTDHHCQQLHRNTDGALWWEDSELTPFQSSSNKWALSKALFPKYASYSTSNNGAFAGMSKLLVRRGHLRWWWVN